MSQRNLSARFLSALLMLSFSLAPAAQAQSLSPAAQPSALRLTEQTWDIPQDQSQALLQSTPAYDEPPAVPAGVGSPGERVSSGTMMLALAAMGGAVVGGMCTGVVCCGLFFAYYY